MNICFLWFFDKAPQVYGYWHDGLRAALKEIEKTHSVEWVIGKNFPVDKYDATVIWDDSSSEFFQTIDRYHGKKALCLTTDPVNVDNLRKLDAVLCESTPVYEAVRSQGLRAIKAFGTDTEFFKPDETVKKDIEYFYPATFSPWKLQRNIFHLGSKLTCVGTVQPDGLFDLGECRKNGVNIEQGYFPAEKIRDYYRRAKNVMIPAIHGSERTVLESLSCGIVPVVNQENRKAYSYIQELENSGLTPREFVVRNYSHVKYAEQILKGIV